jgi:hypothetical protein
MKMDHTSSPAHSNTDAILGSATPTAQTPEPSE